MSVSEQAKSKLHQRLDEVLGHEEAVTMMELVPASGWADVARTHHLDHLEVRMEAMEHRLDAKMERLFRTHLLVTLGLNLSLFGGILAIVRL